MEMDSIFANALRALFRIGNELFGLQSLAERGLLYSGTARATIASLRRNIAEVTAALDGIERQIEAQWPKKD